jgi:ankyrin repeat protein
MLKDMFDGNNSVQPQSPVTEAQPGGSSGKSYTPAQINDLYDAVKSGNIEKVKTLLAGNPDLVTAKKDDGTTPLHWAANNGKKKIVEMLLEHGADVNAKDNAGYTPLHLALWNGSLNAGIKEMVEVLLAHGADVNAKADDGKTPLDWAMSNHHDIVEILRAHGGKSGKDIK